VQLEKINIYLRASCSFYFLLTWSSRGLWRKPLLLIPTCLFVCLFVCVTPSDPMTRSFTPMQFYLAPARARNRNKRYRAPTSSQPTTCTHTPTHLLVCVCGYTIKYRAVIRCHGVWLLLLFSLLLLFVPVVVLLLILLVLIVVFWFLWFLIYYKVFQTFLCWNPPPISLSLSLYLPHMLSIMLYLWRHLSVCFIFTTARGRYKAPPRQHERERIIFFPIQVLSVIRTHPTTSSLFSNPTCSSPKVLWADFSSYFKHIPVRDNSDVSMTLIPPPFFSAMTSSVLHTSPVGESRTPIRGFLGGVDMKVDIFRGRDPNRVKKF